jgi:hypothetical protein
MSPAPTIVAVDVCPTTGTAASTAAPHASSTAAAIEAVRRTVFLIPSVPPTKNGKEAWTVSPAPPT